MNISILKIVVLIIGIVLVIFSCGIVYLQANDKNIPDVMATIIVAGITGLLGLLAPSKDATNPNN